MNLKKIIQKENIASVIVAIALFAAVPAVLAWTAPSATPPNGNVPAPINVGSEYQVRQGKLGLYGPGTGMLISTELDYNKDKSGYSALSSLLLAVNGRVGASEYCDERGLNCIDLSNLIGNTTYINNNSTTTTACTQKTKVSPFYYAATNSYSKDIDLPAGNWKITGQGTAGAGGKFYIWVSNNGKFDATKKTFVQYLGERDCLNGSCKPKGMIGATPAGGTAFLWKIPDAKGTFTLTSSEKLRIAVSSGSIQGTVTFEGPTDFVCSSTAGSLQ